MNPPFVTGWKKTRTAPSRPTYERFLFNRDEDLSKLWKEIFENVESFSLMIFKNLLLFQDLIDSESFYEYDDYYIFEYFRAFLFTIKFLIL